MKEIAVFILVVASVITYSSAHSCYVCGNGADEPFTRKEQQQKSSKNVSMIPSNCDEFERVTDAAELAKFIWDCPPNYQGCSVEIDGHQIIRTCEERKLNDCKPANGVIYCYCNSDLCNSKKALAIKNEQRQLQKKQKTEKKKNAMISTDDEDLEESSGDGDNYSEEERRRKYSNRNNINTKFNDDNYGIKTKQQIVQVTLATAALNLTTPRPITNSSSVASSLHTINTKNVLLFLFILLGINLITIRNTGVTRRIKI